MCRFLKSRSFLSLSSSFYSHLHFQAAVSYTRMICFLIPCLIIQLHNIPFSLIWQCSFAPSLGLLESSFFRCFSFQLMSCSVSYTLYGYFAAYSSVLSSSHLAIVFLFLLPLVSIIKFSHVFYLMFYGLGSFVQFGDHLLEVRHGAKDGVDGRVVGDVVAEVLHGRLEEWTQPHCPHAKASQIVRPQSNAWKRWLKCESW